MPSTVISTTEVRDYFDPGSHPSDCAQGEVDRDCPDDGHNNNREDSSLVVQKVMGKRVPFELLGCCTPCQRQQSAQKRHGSLHARTPLAGHGTCEHAKTQKYCEHSLHLHQFAGSSGCCRHCFSAADHSRQLTRVPGPGLPRSLRLAQVKNTHSSLSPAPPLQRCIISSICFLVPRFHVSKKKNTTRRLRRPVPELWRQKRGRSRLPPRHLRTNEREDDGSVDTRAGCSAAAALRAAGLG